MRYDVRCTTCGHKAEINKRMTEAMPKCSRCGGLTQRLFTTAPAVAYAAGGFYATDVARFERQVGPDRAAKFNAEKNDVLRRQARGQLTPYERVLDAPALPALEKRESASLPQAKLAPSPAPI